MQNYTSTAAQRWQSLKRQELRRSVRHSGRNETVGLTWSYNARQRSAVGTLANISQQGMAVLVPEDIPIATRVDFTCDAFGIRGGGTVRYARTRDGRYMAGVEFDNGTTWTAGIPKPLEQDKSDFWSWDWKD